MKFVLFVFLMGSAIILKVVLFFIWTQKLHSAHPDRYSFWTIFRMMFAPQSEAKVGKEFWLDLYPIQRWNFISNVMIVFLVTLSMFFIELLFRRSS